MLLVLQGLLLIPKGTIFQGIALGKRHTTALLGASSEEEPTCNLVRRTIALCRAPDKQENAMKHCCLKGPIRLHTTNSS